MRVLMWIKASKSGFIENVDVWWGTLVACLNVDCLGFTHWSPLRNKLARFLINVSLLGEVVRCGGFLSTTDGTIKALFYSPLLDLRRDYAKLIAIKLAVDMFIKAGCTGVMELVLENNSWVVLNWFEIPIARPRVWWETFLELDRVARLIGKLTLQEIRVLAAPMAAF
ncbi:hypothetical protein V6N13_028942 [Hibiscus sabdariffa]|uniref:RNase H type-1 domain-containing protein n=2 Tax=Hibiscus sabdariffa TaxID=183260 RepID=A0ABR2NRV9_9ROSI